MCYDNKFLNSTVNVVFKHQLQIGNTASYRSIIENLDSVYTRQDPFGTGTKLVQISLAFMQDGADPLQVGSLTGTK